MTELKYFLLYPNASIIRFDGVHLDPISLQIEDYEKVDFNTYKECKLKLFRLSCLTEEDKRELAEILRPDLKLDELQLSEFNSIHFFYIRVNFYGKEYPDGPLTFDLSELPYKAADYLRAKSYDVDGLIEKNLAVSLNKEEVKP